MEKAPFDAPLLTSLLLSMADEPIQFTFTLREALRQTWDLAFGEGYRDARGAGDPYLKNPYE